MHTDRYSSTRQFVERSRQLSDSLDLGLTKEDLEEIYDHRSSLAHGQKVEALATDKRVPYRNLERLLRSSIVRAIEDPSLE